MQRVLASQRFVGLCLLVALVVGCEGDVAPDGPEPDQDTIRTGLAALFAGDNPEAADVEAGECFAQELTARTTPAQLQEAGILDADYVVVGEPGFLPETMAQWWVDAQFACTDFVEESTRAQVAATKGKVDAEGYAACLTEALDDEAQRAAVAATLTGDWDSDAVTILSEAQQACVEESLPPE